MDQTVKVIHDRPGPPAVVLRVIEAPRPQTPGAGQVLVRVTVFPVHPGDLLGIRTATTTGAEITAGLEATGVVEQVGPGVTDLTAGTRVSVFPAPGAWSTYVTVPAEHAVRVPDGVPDTIAAQLLVNPVTALLLHRAVDTKGVVLHTAAASAVGRQFSAIAERDGIAVISLVRRDSSARELAARFPGIPVVSTERAGWRAEVERIAAGRPITSALDAVGGPLAVELIGLLTDGGTLVVYGRLDPTPLALNTIDLVRRDIRIQGVTIGRWGGPDRAEDVRSALTVPSGHFDVAAEYHISDIAKAVEHAARPGKNGTVLVRTEKR